jgi:hypothetical protein
VLVRSDDMAVKMSFDDDENIKEVQPMWIKRKQFFCLQAAAAARGVGRRRDNLQDGTL